MSDRTVRTKSATGGIAESGYFASMVETARIVSVNPRDWSVDCVSEQGGKVFYDIQIMNPYLHYVGGEGVYAMPEVGAMCWVCTPSTGLMATPFVLGFQALVDEREAIDGSGPAVNFANNRQILNPGDIQMKTRDGNFLILRRGGFVQIGSTPIAQRFYIPLRNIIKDVCENYEMRSIAGEMNFTVERTEQDTDGAQKTYFRLASKLQANEPNAVVEMRAGAHEDDDSLRMTLAVKETGADDAPVVVQMSIDKDGNISWDIEAGWELNAKDGITMVAQEKDISVQASKGKMTLSSSKKLSIESTTAALAMKAAGAASLEGATAKVKGATIALEGKTAVGGPGGEPIVKGVQLVTVLTEILNALTNPQLMAGPSVPPGLPQVFPGLASVLPKLQTILSTNNTTT